MFSEQDQVDIILEYFGAEENTESPLCPDCGQELLFESLFSDLLGLQLEVSCPPCQQVFSWAQPLPVREWKPLHLGYFVECYVADKPLRCPYDDCRVTSIEFNDGVTQFNCPFCNRRGRTGKPEQKNDN